jgi:polysaccharide deacetylase family protein (PEP-CTERM system associated)
MNSTANPARLVISIDVEDWPQSTWDHSLDITERAAQNTERVLDILARHGKTVTMFVLGKFAERFPDIVKRISAEGHEVASHGFGHIEIFRQSPAEFRDDISRSKTLLEDLVGKPVLGYRAPDFSVVTTTLWALEILAEQGFQYDSSIFPINNKHYGIANWPVYPVQISLKSGNALVELPIATIAGLGRNWPVAGGGYHRLLPSQIIHWAIKNVHKKGRPFIAYCHPYEFDHSEFIALKSMIPLKTRLHQGLGRRGFHAKFERMLTTFKTVHAADLAKEYQWPVYSIPEQAISERGNLL